MSRAPFPFSSVYSLSWEKKGYGHWGASLADKGFSSVSQWLSSQKSHMWSLWLNVASAHLCQLLVLHWKVPDINVRTQRQEPLEAGDAHSCPRLLPQITGNYSKSADLKPLVQ